MKAPQAEGTVTLRVPGDHRRPIVGEHFNHVFVNENAEPHIFAGRQVFSVEGEMCLIVTHDHRRPTAPDSEFRRPCLQGRLESNTDVGVNGSVERQIKHHVILRHGRVEQPHGNQRQEEAQKEEAQKEGARKEGTRKEEARKEEARCSFPCYLSIIEVSPRCGSTPSWMACTISKRPWR